MNIPVRAVAIIFIVAPSIAFADDMKMDTSDGHGAADKAFMESMQTMMKSMNVKPSGDADQDFVTMMLPHHQGAVDMAKVELRYGKDLMLRQLAKDIIKAQNKEIILMKGWQEKNAK